ncbi:hypothetical protein Tco_0683419 [Tanacetum coccineum]|uniref:Uncharacterized protein n=1 Tax=Tanacetum coccineum TaxID=301880 RepID=A0ABQ4XTX1_9ASTR
MAFNLQIQSSQPLDEAWGIVGLPNGIRVLVEEGGKFYPWGGLGCRVKEGKKSRDLVLDDCDVQATNIILHDLPPDVYALVNLQEVGEWHMARQCTQPKRPRNSAWFKEKLMLVEAQEAGQILDEEQLAFIADPGIEEALVPQQIIPQNLAFQTEDLDAYDSDYDDISSAKVVLMVNLSSCDSDILSEVLYSNTYPNDMINHDAQKMPYSEQTHIVDFLDNEITRDSNIIPYS